MKKVLLFISCLLLAATQCYAAKSISVDFSYENRPVTEFRLYMDGQKICSSPDGASRSLTCPAVDVPYGVHLFTMTAVEPPGVETTHSPAYMWAYTPSQGSGPVFINFNITVDGKVIPVGPVEN